MRAFVFSEAQIEPALQRWFGTQQLTTDEELRLRDQVVAFLTSPEAVDLRMPQFDPTPPAVASEAPSFESCIEKAA